MQSNVFPWKKACYWCFVTAAAIAAGVGMLCFPQEAAAGVSTGMTLCLYTLIPSTFPFVVLSSFSVYSGVSRLLGKVLGPITRLLFDLPGCCGSVILLGWIGGYPTGARGVISLYENGSITRAQGERLLWFCTNAGPSFTVSVIGMGLYGDFTFGVLLFCCQTTALFVMGVASGLICRLREKKSTQESQIEKPPNIEPFSHALVLAANDGARGAANLCSFVMLFSALMELISRCGALQWIAQLLYRCGVPIPAAASLFPLTWEITSGVNYSSWTGAPLELLVFFTAVGGLCVAGQILSTTAKLHISKLKFFFSRFVQGALSLLFYLLVKGWFFLPTPSTNVFHNTSEMLNHGLSVAGTTTLSSAVCGTVLLLLCVVFLLCRKGKRLAKNR